MYERYYFNTDDNEYQYDYSQYEMPLEEMRRQFRDKTNDFLIQIARKVSNCNERNAEKVLIEELGLRLEQLESKLEQIKTIIDKTV